MGIMEIYVYDGAFHRDQPSRMNDVDGDFRTIDLPIRIIDDTFSSRDVSDSLELNRLENEFGWEVFSASTADYLQCCIAYNTIRNIVLTEDGRLLVLYEITKSNFV